MNSPWRQALAVILLALSVAAPAGLFVTAARAADEASAGEPLQRFPRTTATVRTAHGTHAFRAWVANTQERRAQGLMYLRQLDADQAMYFPLGPPQWASFWMKNTYVSLDLLFIAADGRVVNIAERATPLSLEPIPASAPVVAVLEVVAGTAARLGIAPGDRVVLARPGH